ncbi:hypothetical protein [Streptomyces sp. NPDC005302]|uniref:hypothetical protein n=1 Tax=Streptomyces sp. NPDC005302 TaxID=3154675 RepID=UPI0033AB3364
MSYINVRELTIPEGEDVVSVRLDADADHSWTDGEELGAASEIIALVRELDNGEALVITRDIF